MPTSRLCRHAPEFHRDSATGLYRPDHVERPEAVQRDIATLQAAVGTQQVEEVFMTAASAGVIANFLPNAYYRTEEAYLYALAEAMKHEYQAIVQAGFLLQIDCRIWR